MGRVCTVFSSADHLHVTLTEWFESKYWSRRRSEGQFEAGMLLKKGFCVLKSLKTCLALQMYLFLCHHYDVWLVCHIAETLTRLWLSQCGAHQRRPLPEVDAPCSTIPTARHISASDRGRLTFILAIFNQYPSGYRPELKICPSTRVRSSNKVRQRHENEEEPAFHALHEITAV